MLFRLNRTALCAFAIILILPSWTANASEGATSLYLPGMVGDILVAVPPGPGLAVSGSIYVQSGSVGTAILQGVVDLGLDLDVALGILGTTYTFEKPFLGGTYTIGAAIPFGNAKLKVAARGIGGGASGGKVDSFNLADIALTPLALNWQVGDFAFRFAETIIAPAGGYDIDEAVNLGRNYWAFDTTAAATYFNANTGTEISIAPGLLANTRNGETNYTTGAEFHLDFTLNQFLSKTFAIGVKGYVYQQVTGDTGSGATLGGFKGEAVGLGPGFVWLPGFADGKLAIIGKWMTDVHAKRHFDSNYATVTAAWSF